MTIYRPERPSKVQGVKDTLLMARWFSIKPSLKKFLEGIEEDKRFGLYGVSVDWLSDVIHSRHVVNDYALGDPGYQLAISNYQDDVLWLHKMAVWNAGLEVMSLPCFSDRAIDAPYPNEFALQLILHDISKYSFVESLGYYALTCSKREDRDMSEREAQWFGEAWHHHKHHNEHHPEHWLEVGKDGSVRALEMPARYVFEMVADWLGASRSYGSGKMWEKEDFDNWVQGSYRRFLLHPKTDALLRRILGELGVSGMVGFGDVAVAATPA